MAPENSWYYFQRVRQKSNDDENKGPGFPAIIASGTLKEQMLGEQITAGQLTELK